MPTPKGHEPFPGCEKGGVFGFLGKPQDAYTEEELHALGKELVQYMEEPKNIWYKGFCNRKRMKEAHFQYLQEKYPIFAEYVAVARQMQKEKLITHPFWKEADGRFATFILEKCHKEFKPEINEQPPQQSYRTNY